MVVTPKNPVILKLKRQKGDFKRVSFRMGRKK